MGMSDRLNRIRGELDRSSSLALIDELQRAESEGMAMAIIATLHELDDPRVVEPLQQLLANPEVPANVRRWAGHALREMDNAPPLGDGELRSRWEKGDEVIRGDALLHMQVEQRDIVEMVLDDPDHPQHVDAVAALTLGFSYPWAVERLIAALSHPKPDVRIAASEALLWTEAVRAEDALHAAARDEVSEVAVAALNTLTLYPTQRTLELAARLRVRSSGVVRDAAEACFRKVRNEACYALVRAKTEGFKRLRSWLQPIWSLLEVTEEELQELRTDLAITADVAASTAPRRIPWSGTVEEFTGRIRELDRSWAPLITELKTTDWGTVPKALRPELGDVLATWPDVLVRKQAPSIFAVWQDRARLLELCQDSAPIVRTQAMHQLRNLDPDPELAGLAWNQLPHAHDMEATETLATAIALSVGGDWVVRASEIVEDVTLEEWVRVCAVSDLAEAGKREAISAMMHLLSHPPVLTWGLHENLIEAAYLLDIALPDVPSLTQVDHVGLQEVLSKLEDG